MIGRFLQQFIPELNEHPSDDCLASLFCNELPYFEQLMVKRHLAKCWRCRVRQEKLEGPRADRIMNLYREAVNSEDLWLSAKPRTKFAKRLELHLQRLPRRRGLVLRPPDFSLLQVPRMRPSLVTLGVLVFPAIAAALLFWWQQRVPDITSNTLLVRAGRWDSSNLETTPGVVYQTIRITTPAAMIERSIYRDLQGKRLPKHVKLAATQEKLKLELASAGVNWDEPISASDYQNWHDHQHVRADKIARAGAHLLRLTTTVPDSLVAAESLTVRDKDFHPVRRTVALRDVGTVDIAELAYKIMPWSAIGAEVFAPSASDISSPVPGRRLPVQLPKVPRTVTQEQLDEAELGARLVLNQLHADSGEQIEIQRNEAEIKVQGIVETDERKRELQMQLRTVPHVRVSILSVADLKNTPVEAGATGIQTASMPNQSSPLETYLQAHGRNLRDINALAQRFFATALTISQESKAIVDLQKRFVPEESRTIIASATLAELIYSHRERLASALQNERALVTEAQITPAVLAPRSEDKSSCLMTAAERNLALTRELNQTNVPATRSAAQILAEMSFSIEDLVAAANDVYGKSQSASTLGGKN